MKRVALIALACLFNVACGGEETDAPPVEVSDPSLEPGEVEVRHYRVPCQGEGRQLCLEVRRFGEEDFELHYDGIEGFDFVWGEHAVLAIRIEVVADPPADGSSERWILEEQVERTPVRQSFELTFEPGDLVAADPMGLRLGDDTPVICASEELCRIVVSRMDERPIVARMRADADGSLTLFRLMQ